MSSRPTRRTFPKTRVLEHELKAARKFVQSDPVGKRLQAAEHILTLLLKEEFPRVKRFIFNAAFDLRKIVNPKQFEKTLHSNPKLSELLQQSKTGGYVRIHFDKENIQFVLFYEKDLNPNEASLFSETFGRIIVSTYSSLGLDMGGYASRVDIAGLKDQGGTTNAGEAK